MSGYTVQGFNPFLSEADIVQPPPVNAQYAGAVDPAMASNPFLAGAGAFSYDPQPPPSQPHPPPPVPQFENPFLSSMTPNPPPPQPSSYGGGNPFADFVQPPPPPQPRSVFMELGAEASDAWTHSQMNSSFGSASEYELQQPVSTSTQDLLSTVTGALEATSDSLLDRLRFTQPSPIPQLPSPTPSPRSPSPDLLMGDEDVTMPTMYQPPTSAAAPQPKSVTTTIDIMGLYNTPSYSKPSFPEPKIISIMDQDDVPPMELTGIIDVTVPEPKVVEPIVQPTPPIQPQQHEAVQPPQPLVEEIKAEVMEILKEAEAEFQVPKVEVKAPEKPPPARPAQPPPPQERKPSPLPSRPPPPVPPAPRKEPEPAVVIPTYIPPATIQQPPPPAAPVQTQLVDPNSPVFEPPDPIPFTPQPPAPAPVQASPFSADPFGERSKGRGLPPEPPPPRPFPTAHVTIVTGQKVDFDSFEDRFNADNSTVGQNGAFDSFGPSSGGGGGEGGGGAWGDTTVVSQFDDDSGTGFGADDKFDEFLSLREPPPVPQSTPAKSRIGSGSDDYDRDGSISVTIKPRNTLDLNMDSVPSLAPPPKSPAISTSSPYIEDNGSFVPFLSSVKVPTGDGSGGQIPRTDSLESPQTPLFDEDQSKPLEDFPRIKYSGDGWEMQMRHPNKKKITGQRFWKKVYVRLVPVNDIPTVQIFITNKDRDPIQEIPLQPCYSVSDIAAQQFDQYGKIFTVKLQFVFYKERPGVRPGQITKAERITNKLSQFAAYAIQGDYQGVKEFGSDLKKLGLPLEHAPQISQLVKLGTQNYEEMKQFSMVIEEALFRLPVHRDRALTYKSEEVQVTLVDEYYVEQDVRGIVTRQIARVRLHFLSFLSGAAEVELGINDIRRQGKEVVGRHDIIPIATEEWIRIEDIEFNSCVQLNVFEDTKMVKFKPPDACYIELLRFRVRPPVHRELPLQVKTVFTTTGHRIEIRCDILVPGFTSRKLGQIPCEDVSIRIPIPECWIYMFRVEKHFRYGSVKSAHRRSGKVKGIERFLGAVEAVENSLMEVTSGQAKYEHQHKSIVWRVARLPKEGQGAYTTHSFFCHITLQQHEEIPENLTKHCYVEFTMPHTTISHTVCRSVSVPNCDEPPEKCVKYLSRHEYIVEIEHSTGVAPGTYNLAATVVKEEPEQPKPEEPMEGKALSDSDFSDD